MLSFGSSMYLTVRGLHGCDRRRALREASAPESYGSRGLPLFFVRQVKMLIAVQTTRPFTYDKRFVFHFLYTIIIMRCSPKIIIRFSPAPETGYYGGSV